MADRSAGAPLHVQRSLERARQSWTVEISEIPSMVVSKTSLPAKPKVTVLPGY